MTHTHSVSSRSLHTDTCRSNDCPLSDPHRQQSSPSQAFSLSRSDLCSLGDSRTVGIVLTLTDLTLSCRLSLTQWRADSRRSLDSSHSLSDLFVLAPSVASPAPIKLLRLYFLQLRAHSTFCCTLLWYSFRKNRSHDQYSYAATNIATALVLALPFSKSVRPGNEVTTLFWAPSDLSNLVAWSN